jgi:hypothetical protein
VDGINPTTSPSQRPWVSRDDDGAPREGVASLNYSNRKTRLLDVGGTAPRPAVRPSSAATGAGRPNPAPVKRQAQQDVASRLLDWRDRDRDEETLRPCWS